MRLSRAQMQSALLRDEDALVADVIEYLGELRPQILRAYPQGYFIALIRESVRLAQAHRMDDVEHVRLFVDLRWQIAAGWFREPEINAVLQRVDLCAADRFALLVTPAYDMAWSRAEKLDSPAQWRGAFWTEAWQ